ncbi:hypothetical protein JZ751_025426 [Albula glossodonta]|uniref:Uncharacterized protein n=1 Tax=Albula glossodonta TaxID=121402 RepID=A0A8T2MY67_9TELE|nr:hypothetical protein JZ751_025426 [Albula glossodonta]
MPTVAQLLQTPLFSDVTLCNSEKLQFKITTKLKDALKTAKECLERRLQEEQKMIHQHRRLTRAQSHHGSEEEKKRRKILARKVRELALPRRLPPPRLLPPRQVGPCPPPQPGSVTLVLSLPAEVFPTSAKADSARPVSQTHPLYLSVFLGMFCVCPSLQAKQHSDLC